MEIVLFLYGLAFVLLGATILVQPRASSEFAIASLLSPLALFGLTHGAQEWLDMWLLLRGPDAWLAAAAYVTLAASYVCLFEFARRLIRMQSAVSHPYAAVVLSPWLYVPMFAGVLALTHVSAMPWLGFELGSRYFIGLPAGLLAGAGLILYPQWEQPRLGLSRSASLFKLAGIGLAAFGLLSGLIGSPANFFPASVLNTETFFALFHLPVELFRAAIAFLIAFTVGSLLWLFHTESKSRLQRALASSQLASYALQATSRGVIITDAQGRILSVNPAFVRNTGYSPQELVGRSPRVLHSDRQDESFYREMWQTLNETGEWQGEIWNRHKNGAVFPEWLTISAVTDQEGRVIQYVGIYSDVSAREALRERLHYLAYYDPLTGLPNRLMFDDHLRLAMIQARREGHYVGVMLLDLDQFKNVNDMLGYGAGDRLLKLVAGRLQASMREGDTLSRFGGDEFTVVMPNLNEPLQAAGIAQKVQDDLKPPFGVDDVNFNISSSIGMSIFPVDGETPDALIKNADTAMHRAKELGRNHYQFYTPEMSARFEKRVQLETQLRRAIENGGLEVVYQPEFELKSGRVVGMEALARWRDPELGEVPPLSFIPVAEETGLVDAFGQWVLREACTNAKQWVDAGNNAFRVAVNLSGQQLRRRDLVQTVAKTLEETHLDPKYLELELTESVLMLNADFVRATLRSLNEMGVRISIDDFGTGYSSLSYLKQFVINKLKIDQSFVRDLPMDSNDAAIATTIIAMGHTLNLTVLAEGVETQDQLNFLRNQGCDQAQGFLLSPPLPARAIGAVLAAGTFS